MNNSNNTNQESYNWLWLYAIAVLIFAGVVNLSMFLPIPTLAALQAKDWLGFWGGYLGGVIGCIPAFAALHESKRQAKQQHNEVQEQLEESRKQAKQQYDEAEKNRRLSVKPLLDFDFELRGITNKNLIPRMCYVLRSDGSYVSSHPFSHSNAVEFLKDYQKDFVSFHAHLENIGLGPATNIKLLFPSGQTLGLGGLGDKSSIDFFISFPRSQSMIFSISFLDIYGNNYLETQEMEYHTDSGSYSFKITSSPMLVVAASPSEPKENLE